MYICSNMKNIVSIIIVSFYLLIQAGTTAYIHYCHNNSTHIQLYNQKETLCAHQHHANDDFHRHSDKNHSCCSTFCSTNSIASQAAYSCCADEEIFIQYLTDSQENAEFYFSCKLVSKDVKTDFYTDVHELSLENTFYYTKPQPPPLQELYTLHCALIFYG